MIAALLYETARQAQIDELGERVDARAVADLELRLGDPRRALVRAYEVFTSSKPSPTSLAT